MRKTTSSGESKAASGRLAVQFCRLGGSTLVVAHGSETHVQCMF